MKIRFLNLLETQMNKENNLIHVLGKHKKFRNNFNQLTFVNNKPGAVLAKLGKIKFTG